MRVLLSAVLISSAVLGFAGCGGGTVRGVTMDKTIAHKGGIFNLSQVSHIGAKLEGRTGGAAWQDLSAMSNKELEAWMNGKSNVEAQSSLVFDDFNLPLQIKPIKKAGELKDMQDYARKRINEVNDFMKNNNKQLDARNW